MRRLVAVAVCAVAFAPGAHAATTVTAPPSPKAAGIVGRALAASPPTLTAPPSPEAAGIFGRALAASPPTLTAPVYDAKGHLVQTPLAPPAGSPHLTKQRVLQIVERYPKVHDWLARYPVNGRIDEEDFDGKTAQWTVKISQPDPVGQVVQATVDDASGVVTSAWTGPQVAWGMARGGVGSFGGKWINTWWLWGLGCLIFFVGLADFRRPLSLRNLDLLFLLSPTASLHFFNHGNVFASVPLFYPALLWVVVRGIHVGFTGRGSASRPLWPVWVLLGATFFLTGFRIMLNHQSSNIIDVGYSGIVGAERIVHGQAPWGHFPIEGDLKACGPADATGEIRDRIQTNGRCESANPQGDTYGPVAYEAYIPGYAIFGWNGKWPVTHFPSVQFTAVAFDLLCLIGLWLVGLRFGGMRLAATLAFAWAAYPFTQYASSSNTNDSIMPAFLIWGFWLVTSPVGRGIFGALSGWTKFASLIVAPLWATYPNGRPSRRFVAAFAATTLVVFSVVLLEPSPLHELHVFWDRTVKWQIDRPSPWSLWDWRQYHARGIPDLHVVQRILQALLVAAALVFPFYPRRKSPLQLAALTAALLAGFQLVLTYWLYTYIPWFFGFAAIALFSYRKAEQLDVVRAPSVVAVDDDALDPDPALGRLEPNR